MSPCNVGEIPLNPPLQRGEEVGCTDLLRGCEARGTLNSPREISRLRLRFPTITVRRCQDEEHMAKRIHNEPSRTLVEFRLLPAKTTEETSMDKISVRTPLVFDEQNRDKYFLNTPIVAAAMQSVSGVEMGIELAKLGGAAFVYCSQPISQQSEMVSKIKNHKAGFVEPVTVSPDFPISDLVRLSEEKGFTTFPVVDDHGSLLGMITKNDYGVGRHENLRSCDRMIERAGIVVGVDIVDLSEANAILVDSHQAVLPIVDRSDRLMYLVFRKDIRSHLDNPYEVVDERKRLLAAAAINTHDYTERVPALVEAEVDVVSIDASDGFSVYQEKTLEWIAARFPNLPVIGGNIITGEGFNFLVEKGAKAVKVGMGGGSICITQEQKGTGRGLATAIVKVAEARDHYEKRTGIHIPIIADGGIMNGRDVVVALALGVDYAMMGRYFARMEESPTKKVTINNRVMKPYWVSLPVVG